MSDAASDLHVIVRGRVQGVGFRWFVREEARRLDLAGWTRNLDDGGVEVRASGESRAVATLREAIGRGPTGARVDALEEVASAPSGTDLHALPKPFAIQR